jgi:hypothetical protein
MNWTEILVSRLGTQHEPFGVLDALLVLALIAAYLGAEYAFGRLVSRAFRSLFGLIPRRNDEADR